MISISNISLLAAGDLGKMRCGVFPMPLIRPKLVLTTLTLFALLAGQNGAFAATRTWIGLGSDPFWANTGNWSSGIRPAVTDDVVFPSGAAQLATLNNWIGALHSITFGSGGYSISGNALI